MKLNKLEIQSTGDRSSC